MGRGRRREGDGEALSLIERAEQHECGRLFGMVVPAQIDTCTDTLLKDSFQEAEARRLSWQIHAAQSVVEFHEITRRHGKTPIGWLDSMGLLSTAPSSATASSSTTIPPRAGTPRPT
jgi:5-methylthioadenosine/S-adenosylhomocysteine deaminase